MHPGKKLYSIENSNPLRSAKACSNPNYKPVSSYPSLQQLELLLAEEQSKQRQQVQKIECLNQSVSDRLQMLENSLSKSKQNGLKQVHNSLLRSIQSQIDNHIQIANTQNRIEITKKQISYFNNKIEQFMKQGQAHGSLKSLQINALLLQQKIEHLQCEIQKSDPISHEQFCSEQLIILKKESESLKAKQASLNQILSIRKIQETIEKNKLVVELGKYEALQKEEQEKRQNLKSLIRHSEQIKQRIEVMRKQNKMKVNKKNSKQDVNRQIQAVQKQNKALQQEIIAKEGDAKRLIQQVKKCGTIQKMQQIEAHIIGLKLEQQKLSQELLRVKEKQKQVQRLNVDYQALKKDKKKKIYKKDKKLKNSQSIISEVQQKLQQTKQRVELKQKQSEILHLQYIQLGSKIKQSKQQIFGQSTQQQKQMQRIEQQALHQLPKVEPKQGEQTDLHQKPINDQYLSVMDSVMDSKRNGTKEKQKQDLSSDDRWFDHLGWSFVLIIFLIALCSFVIYL